MAFQERGHFLFYDESRFAGAGRNDRCLLDAFSEIRAGDLSVTQNLAGLIENADTAETISSALVLLSYAAPRAVILTSVPPIEARLLNDPALLEEFCIALARSGTLDAVETSADIYSKCLGPSEGPDFPYHVSITIEKSEGGVFFGPQPVAETIDEYAPEALEFDMVGYRQVIASRISALRTSSTGQADMFFLRGCAIDLSKMATDLRRHIPKAHDNEEVNVKRCVLEAFTGFDLSGFYTDGRLDRRLAAAALERLFDVIDLSNFEVGQKYFLGRPV